IAVREAGLFGTPLPPSGKGRRSGARNDDRRARLADLRARYLALPSESERCELLLTYGADRDLVAGHPKRWNLKPPEARADWPDVQRGLTGTGHAGHLTPLAQALASGDAARIRRERKRLARLQKTLGLQDL